jgi:hypothetical protein
MMPSWLWFIKALKVRSLCTFVIAALFALCQCEAEAGNPWDASAATLAAQIADALGPGPVALSVRNLSSIPATQVPSIRKGIESSLKAHGVTAGGSESANTVRITLSENVHGQLWVAEIIEGNETKVAMVELSSMDSEIETASAAMTLRRQAMLVTQDQILAALEVPAGLLVLEPEQVVLFEKSSNVWKERQRAQMHIARPTGRDPRGVLESSFNGSNFDAWTPGVHCSGSVASEPEGGLKVACSGSDDPWTVAEPPIDSSGPNSPSGSANVAATPAPIRAFYNAGRNSFTGVLVPSVGLDLPPFYSLALIPRISGFAILVDGVDGKVQLGENGGLRSVAGTRDWGSDLAAIHSGCGTGTQMIVSGSGEAASDSLRAYDLSSLEAIPASEPLKLDGSVMALNAARDGKSLLAAVRRANNVYEVDRVTALCN